MNLVLYTHPTFLGLQSQAHFARMLSRAYQARGHAVEVRQPAAVLRRLVSAGRAAKWAGYVDQYMLFPRRMLAAMRDDPAHTLYVFCDQALGPWIPQALGRPHVVHCHDLLALRSALGDVPENPTSLTGRIYQRYIRSGFRRARHFISVSRASRDDLHRFGGITPVTSEVVYNGLNYPYRALGAEVARQRLLDAGLPADERRCLLHVGGGQWYKNGPGVIHLYGAYVAQAARDGVAALPLWMVSPAPSAALQELLARLPAAAEVKFFNALDTQTLEALYAYAQTLLFPSLEEGFGWPIIEALACGCPVLTTGQAPMNEVGGDVAEYLPRLARHVDPLSWAQAGATLLARVLARPPGEVQRRAAEGQAWAARFAPDTAIDNYLAIYQRVLAVESRERT